MAQRPYTRQDLQRAAAAKARQYGVPVDVFQRQIGQESGFNPNARSSAGAQGIAQFIPSTAKAYGLTDPYDPIASLDAAARYDRDLLKRYGTTERALSAYNSGRPDAYRDPHFAGGQTYNYVRSILGGKAGGGGNLAAAAVAPQPPQQAPPALAAAASSVGQPPRDFRPELASRLAAATSSPTHDLSAFYSTLRQAIDAKQRQPAIQATPPERPQPTQTATPVVPIGSTGIAKTALTQLGTPYQWGGPAKLGSRTDCSGLLQASARANGINIGRTTYEQFKQGQPVPLNQLEAGDAVFFHMGSKGPEHVAIYIGGGKVVEDPHTGAVVSVSDLHGRKGVVGARRYG